MIKVGQFDINADNDFITQFYYDDDGESQLMQQINQTTDTETNT